MNCREVLARLYEYLDTELDESDRKSVDTHLEFCTDCLKKYQLEEEFNKVVKEKSATAADVTSLKARVLTEIDKIDKVGGSSSRNVFFLLAPLAAAIIVTLFIVNPWATNSRARNLERFGPFATEHSKCLGDLKDFAVESANPQQVYAVMSQMGVLPEQLFSNHDGEVSLIKGGVANTRYGNGLHLDYELTHGNVSIIVIPKDHFDKSGLERYEKDGKTFYFGSCPKYQYVVWEVGDQDCVAISTMPEAKLMGFVTTF